MDTADTGAEPDGNHDERRSSISEPPSHDVVIVGGGPAGCLAGIFCAREGIDTLIFDRGQSSLRRCAHLENYLGFPEGIDIETFYGLIHDHAERAGRSPRRSHGRTQGRYNPRTRNAPRGHH